MTAKVKKELTEMEQFQNDLLESVRQMKRGEATRVTKVTLLPASEVRAKVGLALQLA